MKRIMQRGCIVTMLVWATVGMAAGAEWQPLFDGRDLSGWHEVGGGKWSVQDGCIVGETGDGRYGWLVPDKEYADFVLKLEFKTEAPGNAGVQFRSHVIEEKMKGYQAEVEPKPGGHTGGVWEEEGTRGWLGTPTAEGEAALKPGQWNTYEISAMGDRIVTVLNGVKCVDFRDQPQRAVSGVIALQVHSGQTPVRVRWRNIRIQDLGYGAGWKPLFDGKDLSGWHVDGAERWEAQNGEIVGQSVTKRYGHLVTDGEYRNFELRVKFFGGNVGNSGVYIRSKVEPEQRVKGLQVEIDPQAGGETAGVYESYARGWLQKADAEAKKLYRPEGWNELYIRAQGDHIQTYLNGLMAVDYEDPKPMFETGVIALQLHSGGEAKGRFKDIFLRPLDAGATK